MILREKLLGPWSPFVTAAPGASGACAGCPRRRPCAENRYFKNWAAADFKDALLRWKMEPEVVYGNETVQ